MAGLSSKQRAMVEFIGSFVRRHSYPPTVREILDGGGISSTSVVAYNLNILESKGYIARDKEISRGIRLLKDVQGQPFAMPSSGSAVPRTDSLIRVPVLGRIAAGQPIHIPDSDFSALGNKAIELTRDIIREQEGLYALEVRGDSMIDALIHNGDIVVMKHQKDANNGDMVAAWIKDRQETTLKRFFYEKSKKRVRLQPENPTMAPIYVDPANLEIQGKVVAVLRQVA